MKKFFQFVALVVVLLLAAQPLLADTACAQQRCADDHSMADCCSHSGSMAMPDSAMLSTAMNSTPAESVQAEAVCSYDSCGIVSVSSTAQVATDPKDGLATSVDLLMPVALFSAIPAAALSVRFVEDAPTPATSRQVLFQVFRI